MERNILSLETEKKVKTLPFVFRHAIYFFVDCIDRIINGKCSEEEIYQATSKLNDNSNGRYNSKDLVNYDVCCDMLGFGKNRMALKRFLDANNVKQIKISNKCVGFPRTQVEQLIQARNECKD